MADNKRDRLLNLVDRKAFKPVLDASPDDYSEEDRKLLQDVQDTTRRERRRFQERDSARGIVDEFEGDLNSDAAEEVQRQLKKLGLPTLPDIEEEFNELAEELDVRH